MVQVRAGRRRRARQGEPVAAAWARFARTVESARSSRGHERCRIAHRARRPAAIDAPRVDLRSAWSETSWRCSACATTRSARDEEYRRRGSTPRTSGHAAAS